MLSENQFSPSVVIVLSVVAHSFPFVGSEVTELAGQRKVSNTSVIVNAPTIAKVAHFEEDFESLRLLEECNVLFHLLGLVPGSQFVHRIRHCYWEQASEINKVRSKIN